MNERIIYLNGEYIFESKAKLSVFDRGLLFADAVYEGFGILDGKIVDFIHHMDRLKRSLGELAIPMHFSVDEMFHKLMHLIEKNNAKSGFLYLHVTRGAGDRAFHYHDQYVPNVFAFTQGEKFAADAMSPVIDLLTYPDLRWSRRDIKSTNLLAQVMAKHAANQVGAYEALMVDKDGFVTEAGSSSFFFVKDDAVISASSAAKASSKLYVRSIIEIPRSSATRSIVWRVIPCRISWLTGRT